MIELKASLPQRKFLKSKADIVIFGGAGGGGKTWSMLTAPLLNTHFKGYNAVIFREHSNQIHAPGGLLEASQKMYSKLQNGFPQIRLTPHPEWRFFNGQSRVSFRHIESDASVYSWQGSEICDLMFDELTHFSEFVFFYMLSRNRSTCGLEPRVKASCNADADSWVAKFIEWWWNPETGYPIPERDGILRWFVRIEEQIHWADTREELLERFSNIPEIEEMPKSVTFIASRVTDNKILMRANPGYMANLRALPLVERERLLEGNWKIKPAAGMYFRRSQIGNFVSIIPDDVSIWVRGWDLAATPEKQKKGKGTPFTSSVLMGKRRNGRYIIADVTNERINADEVRTQQRHKAQQDRAMYGNVETSIPQDPGQAGKDQVQGMVKNLSGFTVSYSPESGSKETRANPMAAQWQAGNFDVLIAPWNDPYIGQLEAFPESLLKDMVDASSRAFNKIEEDRPFNIMDMA